MSGTTGSVSPATVYFTAANWQMDQPVLLTAPSVSQNFDVKLTLGGMAAPQYVLAQSSYTVSIVGSWSFTTLPTFLLINQQSKLISVAPVGSVSSTPEMCTTFALSGGGAGAVVQVKDGGQSICFGATGTPAASRAFIITAPSTATLGMQLNLNAASGADAALFAPLSATVPVLGYLELASLSADGNTMTGQSTITLRVLGVGLPANPGTLVVSLSSNSTGSFSQSVLDFANPLNSQTVTWTDNTIIDGYTKITASVTGGTAAQLTYSGSLVLTVRGFRSPIMQSAATHVLAGQTVPLSFTLGALPYPNGNGAVQLELTLTGPGTLSQLYLTFDGSDWNVPHIAEWTSPSSMSTATVSVAVTGTNAYQYQLAFANPIQLAGMASFQLVTLPPYLLASSMNAMALRTVLWPTPEAEVCVKADVQTVPTSICFHTDAQPAFTLLGNLGAGSQRIVFTAVDGSGADAADFAPYVVEINVLGWMRMVPADGSGSARNPATNSWNATSSSKLLLSIESVGLPPGNLDVEIRSNSLGVFSPSATSSSLTEVIRLTYSAGTPLTFLYRDASVHSGPVTLSLEVKGGALSTFSYAFSTLNLDMTAPPAHIIVNRSPAVISGKVRIGETQTMSALPSAMLPAPQSLLVSISVSGCAATVVGSSLNFLSSDWFIARNFSVTPSTPGETCTVLVQPSDSLFPDQTFNFTTLNRVAITGLASSMTVRQNGSVSLMPMGATQLAVCVSVTSAELTVLDGMVCFDGSSGAPTGAQTVRFVASSVATSVATLHVIPVSGADLSWFDPSSASMSVLAYVLLEPVGGQGSAQVADNGAWTIGSQATLQIRATAVGLTSGTLEVQLSSNVTSRLTPSSLTITGGTGGTTFAYQDGTLVGGLAKVEGVVIGGTRRTDATASSTMLLQLTTGLGHFILDPSPAMLSGQVQAAVATLCAMSPSAMPASGSLTVTASLACGDGTGSVVPPSLSFTGTNFNTPQSVSVTAPTAPGVQCTVHFRAGSPDEDAYIPANRTFTTINSVGTPSLPTTMFVGQTLAGLTVQPIGGAANADVCVTLASTLVSISPSDVLCLATGSSVLDLTAPATGGLASVTFTPVNGSQMSEFVSLTQTIRVLGYIELLPDPSAGLTQNGAGEWIVQSGASVDVLVQAHGIPSGSLWGSMTANCSTTLLPSSFNVSDVGSGLPSFVYKDITGPGLIEPRVLLTLLVSGGTSAPYVQAQASITFVVNTTGINQQSSSTGTSSSSSSSSSSTAAAAASSSSSSSTGAAGPASSSTAGSSSSSTAGGAASSTAGSISSSSSSTGGASGGVSSSTGSSSGEDSSTAPVRPPRPVVSSSTGEAPVLPPVSDDCECDMVGCYMCVYTVPTAILRGPNTVTNCEFMLLDGRQSFGMGAYAPSNPFTFSLVSLKYSGAEYISNPSALPGGPWSVSLGNGLCEVDSAAGTLRCDGRQMMTGAEYTFGLFITNGLMQISTQVTHTVQKVATPALAWQPTGVILAPRTLQRGKTIEFGLVFSENWCAPSPPDDATYAFKWTIDMVSGSNGHPVRAGAPMNHSFTTRDVSLPPYSLVAPSTYVITAEVSLTSANSGITAAAPLVSSTQVHMLVPLSPLQARIAGSDRARAVSLASTFDGSGSFDPDINPSERPLPAATFTHQWSCTINGVPCSSTPILAPAQWKMPQLAIGAYGLLPDQRYTFTLTLVPVDSSDTRTASLSRSVSTLPALGALTSSAPLVTIVNPPSTVDASSSTSLQARALSSSSTPHYALVYSWSADVTSTLRARELGVNLDSANLVLPARFLQTGTNNRWTITVRDPLNNATASASVVLFAQPSPTFTKPFGGGCSVEPLSATALESVVTVSCKGYHSPLGAEPLSYSFRMLDSVRGPSVEQQMALSDLQPISALVDVRLPADVFAVRVYISDSLGVTTSTDAYVSVAPPTDLLAKGSTCYVRDVVASAEFVQLQREQDRQALFMSIMQLARWLNEASFSFGESESLPCSAAAGSSSPEVIRANVRYQLFNVLLQVAPQNSAEVPEARLLWQALNALTGDLASLSRVFHSHPSLQGQVEAMLLASVTSLHPSEHDLRMAAKAPSSPWATLVDSVAALLAAAPAPCNEFNTLQGVLDSLLQRVSAASSEVSDAGADLVHVGVRGSTGTVEVSLARGSASDGARTGGMLAVHVPPTTVASAINKGVASAVSSLDTTTGLSSFAQYHLRSTAFARDIVGQCFAVPSSPPDSFPLWALGGALSAVSTSVDARMTRQMDAALISRVSRAAVAMPSDPDNVFSFNVLLDHSVASVVSVPVWALQCINGYVELNPDVDVTGVRSTTPQGLTCVQWDRTSSTWSNDSCTTGTLLPDYSALQCECVAPATGSLYSLVPVSVAPELFGALFRLPILPNGSCDGSAPGWGALQTNLTDISPGGNTTLTVDSADVIDVDTLWFYVFTACLYGLVAFVSFCEIVRYAGGMNHGHPFRRWLLLSTHLLICGVAIYRVALMCMLYSSVLRTYLALSFSVAFPHVLTMWCFVLACMSMSRASRKLQRNILALEADKQFADDMAAAEEMDDERKAAKAMHKLRVAHALRKLEAKKVVYAGKSFAYLRASWFMQVHVKFAAVLAVLSVLILCALLWATGIADVDQGDVMMRGAQMCEGLLALLALAFYLMHTRIERAAVSVTAGNALAKHRRPAVSDGTQSAQPSSLSSSSSSSHAAGAAVHGMSAAPLAQVHPVSDDPALASDAAAAAQAEQAEESEMMRRDAYLSQTSFEQAEAFTFTRSFVHSSVFQGMPMLCLLVSSLLLLYCGAMNNPGVGFVHTPFVNYAYLLFDVATLLLLIFWCHQTVTLSSEEEEEGEGVYRSKYSMGQEQAAMYAMQAESAWNKTPQLARQSSQAWSLERQSTAGYIDTSQVFRQNSMRFASPHSRPAHTGWAGMGHATSADGALIMQQHQRGGRSPFHLLSSPTGKGSVAVSPFMLPHVPELELPPLASMAEMEAGVVKEVVTGAAAMAATPAKLEKAGWQLFDDPTVPLPHLEPGDRIKEVEQYDEEGMPFEPRMFKRYIQRRVHAQPDLQAEAVMAAQRRAESATVAAAAAAAQNITVKAEGASSDPEAELKLKKQVEDDSLARSLASAKAEMEAAAIVKAKADAIAAAEQEAKEREEMLCRQAEEEARATAERVAAEAQALARAKAAASTKALLALKAAAKAKALQAARTAAAEAKAAEDAKAAADAKATAEVKAATDAKAEIEAKAAAIANAAAAVATAPSTLALPAVDELDAHLSASPREPAVASSPAAAAAASPLISPGGPGSPKPSMMRDPSLRRAPTVPRAEDVVAGSIPPPIPESSPVVHEADDTTPWRFVIIDGVRHRVDEQGNPVVQVVHGRRAAIGADQQRAGVMVREGSVSRHIGPEYKGPSKEHIDAQIVGSLAGIGVRPTTARPQPQQSQAVNVPKIIGAAAAATAVLGASPPAHGRRAGAIAAAAASVASDGGVSSRDSIMAAAAKWKAANGSTALAAGSSSSSSSSVFVGVGDANVPSSPPPPRAFGSSSKRS
jgi:hypothetical protein